MVIRSDYKDSFKIERLVCIATDGPDYIDLARRSEQEYIYCMGAVRHSSMRYTFRNKIIIPQYRKLIAVQ